MKIERAYKVKETIPVGRIVSVSPTDENGVIVCNATSDPLGVYEYEAQRVDKTDGTVGIVLLGVAKVVAGGNVTAGKKAISDNEGRAINCPNTEGVYKTIGTFLENGTSGDYVDLLVERSIVTITE